MAAWFVRVLLYMFTTLQRAYVIGIDTVIVDIQ